MDASKDFLRLVAGAADADSAVCAVAVRLPGVIASAAAGAATGAATGGGVGSAGFLNRDLTSAIGLSALKTFPRKLMLVECHTNH